MVRDMIARRHITFSVTWQSDDETIWSNFDVRTFLIHDDVFSVKTNCFTATKTCPAVGTYFCWIVASQCHRIVIFPTLVALFCHVVTLSENPTAARCRVVRLQSSHVSQINSRLICWKLLPWNHLLPLSLATKSHKSLVWKIFSSRPVS